MLEDLHKKYISARNKYILGIYSILNEIMNTSDIHILLEYSEVHNPLREYTLSISPDQLKLFKISGSVQFISENVPNTNLSDSDLQLLESLKSYLVKVIADRQNVQHYLDRMIKFFEKGFV